MIIVMKRHTPREQIDKILQELENKGFKPIPLFGVERTVIAVIGDERSIDMHHIKSMPGVSDAMPVLKPYKLVSRETKHENTVIRLNGVTIGGDNIVMMAGPCAVESQEQVDAAAAAVRKVGARILRGGAYKPRTSPYSFEGLEEEGLKMLRKAADRNNMYIITEVVEIHDLPTVCRYADILQIGTRNMQNFQLLKAVGRIKKPVLLKRGMSATIKEFLLAAEHIMLQGNQDVILCERGIRTFEDEVRNTLALATVPIVKELSHLPIIVDPSHATGRAELVLPMARAAIAAGADGLLIDVHPNPETAQCDGDQSLTPPLFETLMDEIKPLCKLMKRPIME